MDDTNLPDFIKYWRSLNSNPNRVKLFRDYCKVHCALNDCWIIKFRDLYANLLGGHITKGELIAQYSEFCTDYISNREWYEFDVEDHESSKEADKFVDYMLLPAWSKWDSFELAVIKFAVDYGRSHPDPVKFITKPEEGFEDPFKDEE